jgi:hypothetical protein
MGADGRWALKGAGAQELLYSPLLLTNAMSHLIKSI